MIAEVIAVALALGGLFASGHQANRFVPVGLEDAPQGVLSVEDVHIGHRQSNFYAASVSLDVPPYPIGQEKVINQDGMISDRDSRDSFPHLAKGRAYACRVYDSIFCKSECILCWSSAKVLNDYSISSTQSISIVSLLVFRRLNGIVIKISPKLSFCIPLGNLNKLAGGASALLSCGKSFSSLFRAAHCPQGVACIFSHRDTISLASLSQGNNYENNAGKGEQGATAGYPVGRNSGIRSLFRSDSSAPLSAKIGALSLLSLITALGVYSGLCGIAGRWRHQRFCWAALLGGCGAWGLFLWLVIPS